MSKLNKKIARRAHTDEARRQKKDAHLNQSLARQQLRFMEREKQVEYATIDSMLIVFAWVLHTRFGFGAKRLKRMIDGIGEICSDLLAPELGINVEGMHQQLIEECGIDIHNEVICTTKARKSA